MSLTVARPARSRLERALDALAIRREPPSPRVTVPLPPDGPGPWIVGRGRTARLVLAYDTVSRQHAQVRRTGDGWEILDLDSLNGTRVNGWRVERATLRPGDVVHLGDVRVDLVF